jgi:hypothetical protein
MASHAAPQAHESAVARFAQTAHKSILPLLPVPGSLH